MFKYFYGKGITKTSDGRSITTLKNIDLVALYNTTVDVKIPFNKKTFGANFAHFKTRDITPNPNNKPKKDYQEMKKEYRTYLKSDAWEEKRKMMFALRGRQCEICGKTNLTLQVHHLTYKNIFNESPEDLQVLCKGCHEDVHDKDPKNSAKAKLRKEKRERKEAISIEINKLQLQIKALRREFKLLK